MSSGRAFDADARRGTAGVAGDRQLARTRGGSITPALRVLLSLAVLSAACAQGSTPTRDVDTRESTSADAPRQTLQQMIGGHIPSMMVSVAAKLRIADHLRDGPKSVAELAKTTGAHEDSLYRLLRALTELGLFVEEAGPAFRLNAAAELLRSDVPGSLRIAAETAGEPWMRGAWGALLHSVQTGETAFDHLYGQGTFDWFSKNPEAAALFDAGQEAGTGRDAQAVAAAYDFSKVRSVVDVGGGFGALLVAVLRQNQGLRGVLFDLEHVIAQARTRFDKGLAERVDFMSGDFFKSIPGGHDLYVMKYILHDWNDERSRAILSTTRRAMSSHSRLIVVENIVSPPNQPGGKVGDVFMLVRTGGRNRTEEEYRQLLASGGFDVTGVIPTGTTLSIVEAVPRN